MFFSYLKSISIDSSTYFCIESKEQLAPTPAPRKKRVDVRYKIMAVKYTTNSTLKNKADAHMPFALEEAFFESLGILKMQTCWNLDSAPVVFTTLFTLDKKRSKHTLEAAVNSYNLWFPESLIEVIDGSSVQGSNPKNLHKVNTSECFNAMVSPFLERNGGYGFGAWARHIGPLSEMAWHCSKVGEIVIVFCGSSLTTTTIVTGETFILPFFISSDENDIKRAFGNKEKKSGAVISDIRTFCLSCNIFVSQIRIASTMSMQTFVHHASRFMDLANNGAFTAATTPKCGIFVGEDPEYAAALEMCLPNMAIE
jgi:hypothetical protein